jgi:addiction module HigA family antidote
MMLKKGVDARHKAGHDGVRETMVIASKMRSTSLGASGRRGTSRRNSRALVLPAGASLPPVHPGETVAEELAARGQSATRAAMLMRIPQSRLSRILAGRRAITADTAIRLHRLLGPSPQFFMNLQSQYDLATVERDQGAKIAAEVQAA